MKPSFTLFAAALMAAVVSSKNLVAGQWTLSQFSSQDPVLYNNWNSTATPTIPGLTYDRFLSYAVTELAPAAYTNAGLAPIALENLSGPAGYTILQINFNPPQQAVGGFPFSLNGMNISNVTETVYDENTNIIESASVNVPRIPGSPVFLGIGEATTNIYRVEWRYLNPGFFGVANIIYQPGPKIVLSHVSASPTNMSFQIQPLPGHTNMVQMSTNPSSPGWITISNLTFVGVGALTSMTVPMTNGPTAFLRVGAK
jgi:hypothetical protein